MGLQQRLGFRTLGSKILQQLAQPQLGQFRQAGAEENQGERQIAHLLAERISSLRFRLEPCLAAFAGLQGQQLQGSLPLEHEQLQLLGAGGGGFPLADQPPKAGRQARKQLPLSGIALLVSISLRQVFAALVVQDQQHRLRWRCACGPLAPTPREQLDGALVVRQGHLGEGSPEEGDQLGGHRRQAPAGIEAHDAASVVFQMVVGVLACQLALAHAAHAGEVDAASFWSQRFRQALKFILPSHEALSAGGALREVMGRVGVGEFGLRGWR